MTSLDQPVMEKEYNIPDPDAPELASIWSRLNDVLDSHVVLRKGAECQRTAEDFDLVIVDCAGRAGFRDRSSGDVLYVLPRGGFEVPRESSLRLVVK